jgi:hypothetical protein
MEGLEGIDIQPFIGILNMRKIVKSQYDKLQKGDTDQQYLLFKPVGAYELIKIELVRDSIGKHIRMAHYTDTDLLIVKLPLLEHEAAHGNLAKKVIIKLDRMGVPEEEFYYVGAARFCGCRSSKEGDSSYKPLSSRPRKSDWPNNRLRVRIL